ncbi:MAG: porphobilinogen synthase [Planctomycetota bacterium]|jgi:porphobilinogen synthase
MSFPRTRLRRLRRSETMRAMVREAELSPSRLILPLFVVEGEKRAEEIPSMPGCSRMSTDLLVEECREVRDLGIAGVILFGIPSKKDSIGTEAWSEDGVIARAIREVKEGAPGLSVWADVCLCEYTDHGHCGVVHEGRVVNDETLPLLMKAAVAYANAGADVVAPSDMMDGRVGAIREALDEGGYEDTVLVSYAAKYCSSFYGPFRDAAESAPQFGDRRGYQMDPANALEALREVALDLEEGADMVMVKPAMPYLDVLRMVKDEFGAPTAAYQVSGEYAMLVAAAERGWLDYERAVTESVLSIRRAGADVILTYFAKDLARWLRGEA